jgi:hypothetical protein
MTTSSCSNSLHAVFLLGVVIAAGCTNSGPGGNVCLNEDSPDVPGFANETILRARVTLTSKLTYDAAGTLAGPANGVVGSFTDYTTMLSGDSRRPSTLPGGSPACYALTGTPSKSCRDGTQNCQAEAVEVVQVTVDGVAGGPRDLTKTATGKYTDDNLADPLYTASEVKLKVTGKSDKGFFPGYEQTAKAPDPLQLVEPKPGDASRLGMKDLQIKWKKGNGDFVVIEASLAGSTGKTDKIQCIVLDDGCHTIYHNDLEFMDMVDGTQVKLLLVRKIGGVTKVDATTAAELAATSVVETIVNK